MRAVNVVPRTPPWHAWRNQGITATDACVLMGSDPDRTVWQLWAEKVGLISPPDLSRNPLVRNGIEKEPVARRRYEAANRTMLLPVCAESDEHPVLRASFDGLDDDGIPVEIKCPSEPVFSEVKAMREQSAAYRRYYPQVQQQIYVAGSQRGELTLYCEDELVTLEVPRDDQHIAELTTKALALWDAIERRIEPAKDPARDLFVPEGAALEAWTGVAQQYRDLDIQQALRKAELEKIDERKTALQGELLRLMGSFAQGAAAGIRITRYLQRGNVDYGKLLKDQAPQIGPDLLERYRRTASERVRVDPTEKLLSAPAQAREELQQFLADDGERSLYF